MIKDYRVKKILAVITTPILVAGLTFSNPLSNVVYATGETTTTEDDEAKKIDLGRWLDLQIDLLINGQLDSVKIDFINELLSSMKTRKEDIYIPELEQQRLKNTLSEKFDYLLKNLSLDDLQEFETTIDNFSSGKKSHKH